ncbi:MAG: hypothetical protein ACYDCQ_11165 [Dehalococcoidia bacterium]
MIRRLVSRPLVAVLSLLLALTPVAALAADPGAGQPLGIDWTPIVFWAVVVAVIAGGLLLGLLVDWGNR